MGLKVNQVLLKIDEQYILNCSKKEASNLIRGKITTLNLNPFSITVTTRPLGDYINGN